MLVDDVQLSKHNISKPQEMHRIYSQGEKKEEAYKGERAAGLILLLYILHLSCKVNISVFLDILIRAMSSQGDEQQTSVPALWTNIGKKM